MITIALEPKSNRFNFRDPAYVKYLDDLLTHYATAHGVAVDSKQRFASGDWQATMHSRIKYREGRFTVYVKTPRRSNGPKSAKLGAFGTYVDALQAYRAYYTASPEAFKAFEEPEDVKHDLDCAIITGDALADSKPQELAQELAQHLGYKVAAVFTGLRSTKRRPPFKGVSIANVWSPHPYRVRHNGVSIGTYATFEEAKEAKLAEIAFS